MPRLGLLSSQQTLFDNKYFWAPENLPHIPSDILKTQTNHSIR